MRESKTIKAIPTGDFAMAKVNVKALLIDKGEKYGLILGAVLMLLFASLGVYELSASPDPDKFIKEVDNTAKNVTNSVNGPATGAVPPLPDNIVNPPKISAVHSTWSYNWFFDPIAPPDKRRINPVVLPVSEMQADFMWAKMVANDIKVGADGTPEIGTLPGGGKNGHEARRRACRLSSCRRQLMRQRNAYGPRALPMAPQGLGPMGPMAVRQPAMAAPAVIEGGAREKIEYVPLDPEKLKDKRLAWTIFPRRMVVVQGSFPYKAQIEEIQKALRLDNPIDVFDVYKEEETPLFKGVLVQRQILLPDGTVEIPWADIDVVSNYMRTIYPRKYGDKPDDTNTQYVLLHGGHRLVMPLPILMEGKYPDIRLETIKETIRKQIALNKPPEKKKGPLTGCAARDPFAAIQTARRGRRRPAECRSSRRQGASQGSGNEGRANARDQIRRAARIRADPLHRRRYCARPPLPVPHEGADAKPELVGADGQEGAADQAR